MRLSANLKRLLLLVLVVCFSQAAVALGQGNMPGSVTVRVTTTNNEALIDQAEVRLMTFGRGVPTQRSYTDGGGRVTFQGVTRGSYYIEVEKEGYESVRENIDVNPGSNESCFIRLRSTPDANSRRTVGAVSASSLAAPPAARKEYEKGVAKLKDSPAESIVYFDKAIRLFEGYAEAYAMLGLAHMRLKASDQAVPALTKAVQLDPKLAIARTFLGKLYVEQRQFEDAERTLTESVRLDPLAWDAQYELARCYFNMGQLDKALAHALRARELPQSPTTTHLLLADIYLRKGDNQNALKHLKEFAKIDPASPFTPKVQQVIERLKKNK